MRKPIPIRVGICGCINLYHGELEGRRMRIAGRWYRLQEVGLPNEQYHTGSLKRNRCHFFVDNGSVEKGDICIMVGKEDLIQSPSGKSERLKDTLYDGMRTQKSCGQPADVPLGPRGVARLIRRLIAEMKSPDRSQWLRRMAL